MKKTKLKLKKRVWIIGLILLFSLIGLFAGINIYQNIEYKKTSEYKLLQVGYSKEEITKLTKNLPEQEINKLINSEKNTFLLSLLDEEYYLAKNLDTYLSYHEEHKDLNTKKVISLVNTKNNYSYYENTIDTDISKDYLMLVNKFYTLKEDYVPNDLVKISNQYYYGENHQIRKVVYDAFKDMWNEAYKEDIYLIINSSYRAYQEQKAVYDDYKDRNGTTYADATAARAGYSEHQTGLALDIFSKSNTTTSNFKNSKAHLWLQANAYRFGFIERYTEETENITGFKAEAWHWRYVGVEAATYLKEHNITFDEYYAYFIEK